MSPLEKDELGESLQSCLKCS